MGTVFGLYGAVSKRGKRCENAREVGSQLAVIAPLLGLSLGVTFSVFHRKLFRIDSVSALRIKSWGLIKVAGPQIIVIFQFFTVF